MHLTHRSSRIRIDSSVMVPRNRRHLREVSHVYLSEVTHLIS